FSSSSHCLRPTAANSSTHRRPPPPPLPPFLSSLSRFSSPISLPFNSFPLKAITNHSKTTKKTTNSIYDSSGRMIRPDCHLRPATTQPLVKILSSTTTVVARSSLRLAGSGSRRRRFCSMAPIGCFGVRRGNVKGGLKVEIDSGGEDVFDSESRVYPEHLVIMVNGLIGSSADWRYAAGQFVKKHPDNLIVHRSECNSSKLTFDGVDLMGERLADEVRSVVRRRPEVRKISFVAHSLGGLIARYAVARLYEQIPKPVVHSGGAMQQYEARIAGLEPINFITFASPHLGSRGHKQFPILCGLPFLERRASQTAHLVAGRTGKHLFLTDDDEGRPPLLLRMVNDCDDLKFMLVFCLELSLFDMVGWGTSSIKRQDELPKTALIIDKKYPHIVYIEPENAGNRLDKSPSRPVDQTTDLEEHHSGKFDRIDPKKLLLSVHSFSFIDVYNRSMQVKSYWMNSDGADVIFHMIDNFHL
ncbi:Putative lipase ROG1, partial [Linum perenne]